MKLSCRSSASSVFNLLLTLTARPDQREGAECFLFFLLRKVLVSGFRRGEAPAGCRRVFSHPFTHEFPRRSGNTQDSGVLLSSLGSVNPLTSWVTPGLGGAGQAMGSSGNAIYCIGQILPQPVALSSVRASSVAADATNYYGIAILSGNGATM